MGQPSDDTFPALPGRRAELELLARELERVAEGEARFVALVGAAGVGKTRLMREAARASGAVAIWIHLAPERVTPEDLLEQWLSPLLGTRPLQAEVRNLEVAAACYPRLADLNPIAGGTQRRAEPGRAVAAVARLVASAAERQPIVFCIDDLPELTAETRGLVADLAVALVNAPVAFIATARHEGRDPIVTDPALEALHTRHVLMRLDVRPLDERGVEDLLGRELDADIAPRLLPWIYAQSGGNPLFAVELVRGLRTQGILYHDPPTGGWLMTGAFEDVDIPETIANVLESRRQALPDRLRSVLPALALLGADAPSQLLADVVATDAGGVESLLDELVSGDILTRDAGRLAFAHPLMRELWSATLTEQETTHLGDRALDCALADLVGSGRPALVSDGVAVSRLASASDEMLQVVLHYADAAGDAGVAAVAALESGRRCLAARRVREAAGWGRRAHRRRRRAAHLSSGSTVHAGGVGAGCRWLAGQIDLLMGMALYLAGRLGPAEARLRSAAASPESNNPVYGVRAHIYLGNLLIKLGRPEEARAALRAASANLSDADDTACASARVEISCRLVWNELDHGDVDAAERYLDDAARTLATLDACPTHVRTDVLNNQGHIAAMRGDFAGAARTYRDLVALSRREGLFGLPGFVNNLALIECALGKLPEARRLADESIRLKQRADDRYGLATSWNTLAEVLAQAYEWQACIDACRRAADIGTATGHRHASLFAELRMARAHAGLGHFETSAKSWEAARELSAATGAARFELGCERAWAMHRAGRYEEAERVLADVEETAAPRSELEAARLEIQRVRAALAVARATGASLKDKLDAFAERLARFDTYLDAQELASERVDRRVVELELAIAGRRTTAVEDIVHAIGATLEIMEAPARAADIAGSLAGTAVAELATVRRWASGTVHGGPPATPTVASRATLPLEIDVPAPDDRLRVWTLGKLEVVRPGTTEPVTRRQWGSRKARLLLALFLAEDQEGRGLPRTRLIDTVWPDSGAIDLERTFHVTLTFLRRALGDVRARQGAGPRIVQHEDGLYRLDPARVWCDARAFVEDIRRAAELESSGEGAQSYAHRRRAFERYEGDFFSHFDELWLEGRRERLRRQFIDLGSRLADDALNAGALDDAQDIAERLVAVDALAEEGHQRLIRAYLVGGRRQAARRQLERCRQLLRRELDIEVSAATRALVESD